MTNIFQNVAKQGGDELEIITMDEGMGAVSKADPVKPPIVF
jgi:hypothetical protein